MNDLLVFIAVVILGLTGRFIWTWRIKSRFAYRARTVATGAEVEFYLRLKHALPECEIWPKVALTALLEPIGVGRLRRASLDNMLSRRVDYAILDQDFKLLAVINIDQRSRRRRYEKEKDACLNAAGIRTLHFPVRGLPSETRIRKSIFPLKEPGAEPAVNALSPDVEWQPKKSAWSNDVLAKN